MRITTIPFSFTLLAAGVGYQRTQVLPDKYRITHLYIHGEPSPGMLLTVQIFKWANTNVPTAGVPGGPTIFDDLILAPTLRVSRIPIDIKCDIVIQGYPFLLCYAVNGAAAAQQCNVFVEIAVED